VKLDFVKWYLHVGQAGEIDPKFVLFRREASFISMESILRIIAFYINS
jgi:hypothetical protein